MCLIHINCNVIICFRRFYMKIFRNDAVYVKEYVHAKIRMVYVE